MKKKFEAPELTIILFINDDVICDSEPGAKDPYDGTDDTFDD